MTVIALYIYSVVVQTVEMELPRAKDTHSHNTRRATDYLLPGHHTTRKIQEVVEAFGSHVHMELQQRGVEFTQLFGKYNHLRRPLLERMPAMEVSRTHTSETNGEMEGEVLPDTTQPPDTQAQDSNALLVLLGGDTGEGDIVRPVETSKSTDNQDLLDLLGGLDIGTTIPSTNSNSNGLPNNNNNNILLDSTLLDTTPSTVSELVAYEKNGLRLLFTLERLGETPSTTVIHCTLFHPVVAVSELVAYEKNGLRLLFTLERLGETPSTTVIHCTLFHPVVAVSELVAYEKNGLRLLFTLERLGETPSTTVIHCTLFHPVVAVSELVAYEKNGLRLLFTLERLGETPSTTVIHCTLFHPVVAVSELVAYEKNGLRLLFTLERLGETPSTTVIHLSELVAYEKNGLRLLFTLERLGETPSTTVIHCTLFHPVVAVSELVAYEKNGLRLLFTLERLGETPSTTVIQVAANNYAQSPFTEFLFQAAVPKTFQLQMQPPSGTVISPGTFQLQMQPPSGTVISPGGQITQTIKVINPNRTMLKMRIRISYTCDGTPVQDQADVNNFPPESWQ
ncbi:uncharacterized protein LOC124368380 [Homalodisca vitripennis]|uniref:uncharacterized protein LOC124368380 n=1 Tax=Homalodisca vitripennis TaxID=197043 RepID=UPI001EEBBC2B|nr:uncharacterized protein LOC124368380 [Homalodisca vitripennis]